MAKKQKNSAVAELQSERSALEKFDVTAFKKWLSKHNFALWQRYIKFDKDTQIAIMCKAICDRTDMLNTEAHKKAVQWLRDHNTKGRLF